MAEAGYNTVIYKAGVSTVTAGEAMNAVDGTNKLFQITNENKRVIDENISYTFYEDGTPISISDIDEVMFYIGVVKFKTAKTGTITFSGNYLALNEICFLNSISYTQNNNLQDATTFCSTENGFVKKVPTIKSCTLTTDGFYEPTDNFFTSVVTKDSYIIKYNVNNNLKIVMKLKIANTDLGTNVSDLVTHSTSFESDGKFYLDIF